MVDISFVNAVESIAETCKDHILQDYHNSKMFGSNFTRVYLTATMVPPTGQMNTKYNAEWNDPNVDIVDNNENKFSGLLRIVFKLLLPR